SFNPNDDAAVWNTNVRGVEHVLEFIAGSNVPLYHVSTAYVAGGREGTVYEYELDGRYGFTNTYESSKWEAERLVRSAFLEGASSGAIFRPGILVGASASGAISDFQNVYKFLRLLDLACIQNNPGGTIRIEGQPDTLSNLLPVDWAAKAMWEIIDHDGPECRTYHLTNPGANTLGEFAEWANERLAEAGVTIEFVSESSGRLSSMEALAVKALRHYLPYTKGQPYFDSTCTRKATRTRVPFPEIDRNFYDRLYAYARARQWKGVVRGPAQLSMFGSVSTHKTARRAFAVAASVPAGVAH
ncbi:MAG: sugar nucleotide-binding protein, partial [Candidatus Hydrogenedentes bacterium]|nr:sugar nucleotide-binding protein [Candidatus Hydrogenedentota bacterium]